MQYHKLLKGWRSQEASIEQETISVQIHPPACRYMYGLHSEQAYTVVLEREGPQMNNFEGQDWSPQVNRF